MNKSSYILTLLLGAVILVMCSACGQTGLSGQETETLWVVTEISCSDGMNLQAEMIAERMEKEYPGLSVRLDILPTDPQEREITLKQLRTKIMSGNGPDVYLLPTGNQLTVDYLVSETTIRQFRQIEVEPLFSDVSQAMRNGIFRDIQALYQADQSIGIDSLHTQIMDGGVLDGKRFVLPLLFDLPVLLADSAQTDFYTQHEESLHADATALVQRLLRQGDWPKVSCGIQLPKSTALLPRMFDYSTEQLLISPDDIACYMRVYQQWFAAAVPAEEEILSSVKERALALLTEDAPPDFFASIRIYYKDISSINSILSYIGDGIHWTTENIPLFSCGLSETLESLGVEKAAQAVFKKEPSLRMYPLRGAGGTITAAITYWGAIGGSCRDPELAYSFLRQFLTEEFQWEQYRPRIQKSMSKTIRDPQCPGMIENSWPVRTKGSAAALWDTMQYQMLCVCSSYWHQSNQISREIQKAALTDTDIPALSWEIDEVRFPVTIPGTDSLEHALSQLNEPDGTPTDADIDALAQQVYQGLWWHLAEG